MAHYAMGRVVWPKVRDYISGRKCCCEWAQACVMYTYDNIGERSRNVRFQDFETVRFREGMDFVVEDDKQDSQRKHRWC